MEPIKQFGRAEIELGGIRRGVVGDVGWEGGMGLRWKSQDVERHEDTDGGERMEKRKESR